MNINTYTFEEFERYRIYNNEDLDIFKKYLSHTTNKPSNVFDNPEIRMRLSSLMREDFEKVIENANIDIDKQILNVLNKINNTTLADKTKYDTSLKTLLNIKYTQPKHFMKLSELILNKALNEQNFHKIYAKLCYDLLSYHIEIEGVKIEFRKILVSMCQKAFIETKDRQKYICLMSFIAELYMNNVLSITIIDICINTQYKNITMNNIDSVSIYPEGMSELIKKTYKYLHDNSKEDIKCKNVVENIRTKLDELIVIKMNAKSKFALMDAQDLCKSMD